MLLGAEKPKVSGVRRRSSSLPLGTKGDAIVVIGSSPSARSVHSQPLPLFAREILFFSFPIKLEHFGIYGSPK